VKHENDQYRMTKMRCSLTDGLDKILPRCVDTLRRGGVVCVPTDTVYGLICLADAEDAKERILVMKNRPKEKPFALFLSSWERLAQEPIYPTAHAEKLARAFWPGALTIVVAAEDRCPAVRDGKVGARCPNTPFLLKLMENCGGLLVNTSLNKSGHDPASSLNGMEEILSHVELIIDGGAIPPSPASTVIDCSTHPPKILRPGGITETQITHCLAQNSP
jgi:L-threonylcarbamoyladenylate synthase